MSAIQYETKPAHEIFAILYDGSPESITAINEWVNPLPGEVPPYTTPMGVLVVSAGGEFPLNIAVDNYVYLKDGAFSVASKNAFEMYYQVANGA